MYQKGNKKIGHDFLKILHDYFEILNEYFSEIAHYLKNNVFMKAMTRQQLAYYAGVSVKTLRNWCKPYKQELETMGMTRSLVVLPPHIIQWICDKFCIDVE